MVRAGATKSTSGTGLYYPFIHPRDPNCLKQSLLYWDQVRRITPKEVTIAGEEIVSGDDNPDVIAAARAGLLKNTLPMQYEAAAEQCFFNKVDQLIADKEQLEKWRADTAAGGYSVHSEHYGDEAIEKLAARGLARSQGDWLWIPQELGNFYRHCLASEMSRRIEAPLFTDTPSFISLGESMVFDPPPNATEVERSPQFVQLGIQLPSRDAMASIPMQEIIDFHEKWGDTRRRFRKTIEDILDKVSKDPNAADDYVNEQHAEIKEGTEALRKELRGLWRQEMLSVAKILVPTSSAGGLAALVNHPAVAILLGAAGLALSVVNVYTETKGKMRQAYTSSPYYYRLALEREFR